MVLTHHEESNVTATQIAAEFQAEKAANPSRIRARIVATLAARHHVQGARIERLLDEARS